MPRFRKSHESPVVGTLGRASVVERGDEYSYQNADTAPFEEMSVRFLNNPHLLRSGLFIQLLWLVR